MDSRSPQPTTTWGLTFLRGRLQDQRVSLFNEVQLLSHVAGSERVVTCDHDHLGRGRRLSGAGLRASELQPGDLGAKSLLRTAIEEALGPLMGTGLPRASTCLS